MLQDIISYFKGDTHPFNCQSDSSQFFKNNSFFLLH